MSKQVLSGDLSFLGLGDILQLIGSNGGSGTLRITSKYSTTPGYVHFSKGNIINASAGTNVGIDAAYALFGWTEGEFDFSEEETNIERAINMPRMEIILDGLRMVDDGVTKKMGPVTYEEKGTEGAADRPRGMPTIKGPLVDYTYVVAEDRFNYGQRIVAENTHGGWIWVVMEGVVDIVKTLPQGELPLIRVGDGSFIGSIASLLFSSSPRFASALAASNDVVLGVLDSQRLSREYSSTSMEFRDAITSLDNRLREVSDRAVEIHLKKDNIKEMTKNKKPIIKQGKKEMKVGRIDAGEVTIIRKTDKGFTPLANLKKDDFVGPLPFLNIGHEPDGASVFATPDLKMSSLDPEAMQKEYDQLPVTLRNMIDNLSTCVSVVTRTACEFQEKNVKKK
jgi:hypothetical protein